MNLDVFACLASALATSKHDMQFTPWLGSGDIIKNVKRWGGDLFAPHLFTFAANS